MQPTDSINLLEPFFVLYRKKWWILFLSAGLCFASFFYIKTFPKLYFSQIKIYVAGDIGLKKSPLVEAHIPGPINKKLGYEKQMVSLQRILKNRAFAKIVIEKTNLEKQYFDTYHPKLTSLNREQKIKSMVNIFLGYLFYETDPEKGEVVIGFWSQDNKIAQKVVNAIVDEIQPFMRKRFVTKLEKEKKFITQQLVEYKKELLHLGAYLSKLYSQKNVSPLSSTVDLVIDTRNTQTFIRPEKEILKKANQTYILDIPHQVYLQYLATETEMKKQIIAELTQLLEEKKIEEARETERFYVNDRANLPSVITRPRTKVILALVFMISIPVFSLFFLFIHYIPLILKQDPFKQKEIE